MLKSLLYVTKDGPRAGQTVMVVVRGDHEVNEVRLAGLLGASEVFLGSDADVEKATGAKVGFAGPHGNHHVERANVYIDFDAAAVAGGVAGANKTDHHYKDVWYPRDYAGTTTRLRKVKAGDNCPRCGAPLAEYRGIEAGHIFVLGTKYSKAMGATFLDEKQQTRELTMGCYGIGVSRLVATTIEQHHDEDGIRWPMSVAPYHVHLVTIGREDEVLAKAAELHDALEREGVEVLWDDRDERPGVKFKDADLIGVPLRVTIGAKALAGGNVELKPRAESAAKAALGASPPRGQDRAMELVPVADAVRLVAERVRAALAAE
jgi:prolyl-tRNA synthetase